MAYVVKHATIYDVARAAAVSHQTVTRYLRGFEGIRPDTKERVRRALSELNYHPNGAARLLRAQSINRIGILAHKMEFSGPGQLITGAVRAAQAHGYFVDIASVDGDESRSMENALQVLLENRVSGIFATSQVKAIHETLERYKFDVPVSLASNRTGSAFDDPVSAMPGVLAATHLVELGHHRLGYISGPLDWLGTEHSREGFFAESQRLGAEVLWTEEGDWSAQSGWAIAQRAPLRKLGITAVAVSNDSMAIGFISGLHNRHVMVPQDISVTGVDDAPDSQFVLPSLSTVKLNFSGAGAFMMESLISRIEGTNPPEPPDLNMRLIPRDSTKTLTTDSIKRVIGLR